MINDKVGIRFTKYFKMYVFFQIYKCYKFHSAYTFFKSFFSVHIYARISEANKTTTSTTTEHGYIYPHICICPVSICSGVFCVCMSKAFQK